MGAVNLHEVQKIETKRHLCTNQTQSNTSHFSHVELYVTVHWSVSAYLVKLMMHRLCRNIWPIGGSPGGLLRQSHEALTSTCALNTPMAAHWIHTFMAEPSVLNIEHAVGQRNCCTLQEQESSHITRLISWFYCWFISFFSYKGSKTSRFGGRRARDRIKQAKAEIEGKIWGNIEMEQARK